MYICIGLAVSSEADILLKYEALCFSCEHLIKNDMKKLLSLVIALMLSSICYAQKDVTKFLGIPVDGTKSAMIQKLKAKGFTYNERKDCLEGEFNGQDVEISVVTNNNKVYRIVVLDANYLNESDIKIRFNRLCRQFEKNGKYLPAILSEDYEINENEDISYEMTVHSKRYEAVYFQADIKNDSAALMEYGLSKLSQLFTEQQIENLSKKDIENIVISYMTEILPNKSVWFMISEEFGRYRIVMYYDNEYNKANGEDL